MPVHRSKKVHANEGNEGALNSQYFVNPTLAVTTIPYVRDTDAPETPTASDSMGSSNVPEIYFPTAAKEREAYMTKLGKRLTPHQWDVYDFVLTIPKGKVATYKDVALSAGGSPRSVGNALRNNPFAPFVPCHRVIASSLFIGGFFGEWGKDHKTGRRYNQKLELLGAEGVNFNEKGHLLCERESLLQC